MTFRMIPWLAGFSLLVSVLPCIGEEATCILVDRTRSGDFEVECLPGSTLTVSATRRLDGKKEGATFAAWGRALLVQGQGIRTAITVNNPGGLPRFLLRDRESSENPKPTVIVRSWGAGWATEDNRDFEYTIVNLRGTKNCEITGAKPKPDQKPRPKPKPEPEPDEEQEQDPDEAED